MPDIVCLHSEDFFVVHLRKTVSVIHAMQPLTAEFSMYISFYDCCYVITVYLICGEDGLPACLRKCLRIEN